MAYRKVCVTHHSPSTPLTEVNSTSLQWNCRSASVLHLMKIGVFVREQQQEQLCQQLSVTTGWEGQDAC